MSRTPSVELVATEIERFIAEQDFIAAGAMLQREPLLSWFGIEPARFATLLQILSAEGVTDSECSAQWVVFYLPLGLTKARIHSLP